MAVKKSELYSMLWEACNKLRGGVEPARYKDYVLVKRSLVSVGEGIRQMLTNQKKENIQSFFSTMQLLMAGNEAEGLKYGVIETEEKYYLQWREDERAADDLSVSIRAMQARESNRLRNGIISLCQHDRLMMLIHDFVIFDAGIKKTARHIDQRFLVDRNFDGKFDESDADVRYDLNFAVLAGRESYSCGNLFPSMMKDLGYMTLGERSGGGACTILELNTADGFFYHISAYQMRLTNAAGEVIDAGIVPDAELVKTDADGQQDYSDFYNLDLLSDLINEFYAEEGAA